MEIIYIIAYYQDAREQVLEQCYRAYFQIKIKITNTNFGVMPRGVDNLDNIYINPGTANDEPAKRCRKNAANVRY